MQRSLKKQFLIFVLPTLLAFAVAFVIPFLLGLYLSFTEFRTVTDATFVGLKNYAAAFANSDGFLTALLFTLRFTAVSVILINVFGFLLALALTRNVRGRNLYRTVFFLPNLIGGIVLGYIWQLIFNGLLLPYSKTLSSSATYGFWGLVIVTAWQMIGYIMVIYIAGLGNLPPSILEAAKVDGAGPVRTLFSVMLPNLMPSITICLFLTLTNSFKLFDQNLALTAGAPANQTNLLALDIYKTFYGRVGAEGIGQAKAVIFSALVAAVALLQLYFTRRKEQEF
ncbi:MAG: sugar ABC transporter permease [Clostridia bacterium]|nr:sugar ABC transporter permease [Clostridia bacterium]